MSESVALPRWDMEVVYPGLESVEFKQGFDSLVAEIDNLAEFFNQHHIQRQDPHPLSEETVSVFETVIEKLNVLYEHVTIMRGYIGAFVSTNSRDNVAQARMSELQQQTVVLSKLDKRSTAWIGSLDVEGLITGSSVAQDHAYLLHKTKADATHLMEPLVEDVASELGVTGGSAWGKLHSTVTSQLTVRIEIDGMMQSVPMSVIRNLAHEPDRALRRRAYEVELKAWDSVAVPLAAALNSIKGESNALASRRNWGSVLDTALFQNNIDRRTLDAMMEASMASFPNFRRYLRAKAHALGVPALAWYDLFAPVSETKTTWDYEAGTQFLLEQFGSYSPRLREFAARAFRENWIDVEPREGKVGGAFCMSLRKGESRVLTNYIPSYDGVSTVAHELGHAYHNYNLIDRSALQSATPMTLAETASIFCETIIRDAALARADQQEQTAILEASIQGSCQVVVDIWSRFKFESAVLEQRRRRELSIDELQELMLDAQRETYGDGLDQNLLHPYMWAVKGHYYNSRRAFYNFPYMFGLLFGLGLYAQYQKDPEAFQAGYDDFLSSTGLADAASLAQRFGIDIRTPDFWHSSLAQIGADIDRFEQLTGAAGCGRER